MNEKIRIIGIGGSLEKGSATLIYLKSLLKSCSSLGAEVKLLDIKKLTWPMFNYSKKPASSILKTLDEIHNANGLFFASPEYHGTVSASFKNIIDYFEFLSVKTPPYLSRKPIGCIALAGAENAGGLTLNTLINIVQNLRGIPVPASFAVGSAQKQVDEKGNITNEKIKRRLKRLAEELYYLSVKLK